jgi:hypothetical protein
VARPDPIDVDGSTYSAALAGWNATIISDQLSVRNYNGYGAFTQTLAVGGASIYLPPVASTAPPPSGVEIPIPADIQSMTAGKVSRTSAFGCRLIFV